MAIVDGLLNSRWASGEIPRKVFLANQKSPERKAELGEVRSLVTCEPIDRVSTV
jgi:hypothetical protein